MTATTRDGAGRPAAPARRRVRVAPVVSTSSTRRTLRGTAPRGLDPRRLAEPLGPPAADLAAAAAPGEAGLQRRLEPLGQGAGQLAGRDRSRAGAAARAPAAPARRSPLSMWAGRQPLDPVGHQLGDRQQAAELQRRRRGSAATPSCGGRGPGAVEPRRAPCRAAARPRPAAARSGCRRTASGRQDRPQAAQSGGASAAATACRISMPPILRGAGARVARTNSSEWPCQSFVHAKRAQRATTRR